MVKKLRTKTDEQAVLTGRMLCIDPSSGGSTRRGVKGVSGWALFENGQPIESGTVAFPNATFTHDRIKEVYKKFEGLFGPVDVLVLEEIPSNRQTQKSLIQACGAIIAAVDWTGVFEVNVKTWQSIANQWGGWEKTDEQDALYMGYSAVAIALGYHSGLTPKNREIKINEAKEVVYGSSEERTESETEGSTGEVESVRYKAGIRKKRSRKSRKGTGKRTVD